jgi:hypothetical protein
MIGIDRIAPIQTSNRLEIDSERAPESENRAEEARRTVGLERPDDKAKSGSASSLE